MIAMTPYEASLLTRVHNAPPSRVHVVPNGVEEVFLTSQPSPSRKMAGLHGKYHRAETGSEAGPNGCPGRNPRLDYW